MADSKPFASQAQRDKWKQLVQEGKVSQAQYDARQAATDEGTLPVRAAARTRTVGPSRSFTQQKAGNTRY
jgi:hypothetical protein